MKRLLMICVSLCISVLAASAMSAAPSDFSGTWELDKSKSEMAGGGQGAPDSITWKVTQAKDTVTIETKQVVGGQERPATTLTYKLDGSETTAEMPGRGGQMQKVSLKAKWQGDGKILELTRVRTMNMQGQDITVTNTEHLELDGGKVLKVHSVAETPQGKRESKLVFNKK